MRVDDAAGNTCLSLPDGEGTGAAKEDGKAPNGFVDRLTQVLAQLVKPFTLSWAFVGKVVAPMWWGLHILTVNILTVPPCSLTRIFSPRFLTNMASYDVASDSNICQALHFGRA